MLKRLFNQKSEINNPQSGLYHYRREGPDEKSASTCGLTRMGMAR